MNTHKFAKLCDKSFPMRIEPIIGAFIGCSFGYLLAGAFASSVLVGVICLIAFIEIGLKFWGSWYLRNARPVLKEKTPENHKEESRRHKLGIYTALRASYARLGNAKEVKFYNDKIKKLQD